MPGTWPSLTSKYCRWVGARYLTFVGQLVHTLSGLVPISDLNWAHSWSTRDLLRRIGAGYWTLTWPIVGQQANLGGLVSDT